MKDTWRLRGTLRIAILGLPLLAGCSKSPKGGGARPSVTASPSPSVTASPTPVYDGPVDAHKSATCGLTHNAVVPAEHIRRFWGVNAKEELGCPSLLNMDAIGPLHLETDFGHVRGVELATDCTREEQAKDPKLCVYTLDIEYPREGRPAIERGQAVLAPLRAGAVWRRGGLPAVLHLDAGERAARAQRWLAAARAEHASVASFGRAAIELLAVGAPPALLTATSRAMADEVRHAELSFAIASAYAGEPLDPGELRAIAPRGGGIAAVARDVFVEGCVAETDACVRAERQLGGESDPAVRAALHTIIRDETRHAELAWQTLAWALAAGGDEARAAVAQAARTTPHPESWDDVIAPSLALLDA